MIFASLRFGSSATLKSPFALSASTQLLYPHTDLSSAVRAVPVRAERASVVAVRTLHVSVRQLSRVRPATGHARRAAARGELECGVHVATLAEREREPGREAIAASV